MTFLEVLTMIWQLKSPHKKAWGKLIDKGINVMQTDWPGIMSDFIEKYI